MAEITLTDATFNLASDLTDELTVVLTGETDASRRPATTRRYSAGRVRAITRPGVKKELGLSFDLATRAQLDTLVGWVGQTVLYRDPLGRRMWGVFGEVQANEIPGVDGDSVNVNLTLSEITFDEVV